MLMSNIKRFLYLQNSPQRHSVSKLEQRFADAGFDVDFYWAYNGDFPASIAPYHGVLLSGSAHGAYEDIPFIHQEHALIAEIAQRQLPTLGLCFGSQILASALCGRDQVFRRSSCEVGFKWLDVDAIAPDDPLTADLNDRVYMFVWHNDEVRADHKDMNILARSDLCPNQIWRFRDLPIWGIQGHPEISRQQSRIWFEQNRERLEQDGADIDQLNATSDDATQAKTMLTNFVRVCLEH
jgi:GMP synthase-like glutamine amidotransferase